jgi:hypothetical protein
MQIHADEDEKETTEGGKTRLCFVSLFVLGVLGVLGG